MNNSRRINIAEGNSIWQFEMETVKHYREGKPHKRTYTNSVCVRPAGP